MLAQLSPPDMRLPIQYALTYPERLPGPTRRLDWLGLKSLSFEQPDHDTFGAVELGFEVARRGGTAGAALNAAKEIILHRVGKGRASPQVSRYLKLYFLAQDIHERASSSHYPYHALAETFFHSDVLFRCQLLLQQQGKACPATKE